MSTPITINPFPLGAIAPTSGTPASILANFQNLQYTSAKIIVVYAPTANSGKAYVGTATMEKSTFAGVLAVVDPGETKAIPYNDIAGNRLDLTVFYVDVDTTGDKLIVTVLFA